MSDSGCPGLPYPNNSETSVAFCGNSMLYYNDCPRIFALLAGGVIQNSCLRGGATLSSLWDEGNGMRNKFGSKTSSNNAMKSGDIGAPTVSDLFLQSRDDDATNEKPTWDAVVLNDHTQGPAREESCQETLCALEEKYIPSLSEQTLVVFVQTPAYQHAKIRGSEDLGDFDSFSERVLSGVRTYEERVTMLGRKCKVARVGECFRLLRDESPALWEKLYSRDYFHPSPHGTWLQACVLFCALFDCEPPKTYKLEWWNQCRYMQPTDHETLPLPSREEAEELRKLACRVCLTELK